MTIGILPKHLLEGKDMQTDEYFHNPIGTGPYKIQEWDEGQSITLVKNENYYKGAPKIDTIVFKIVPDDNAKALQLKSGEINLAKVTPKDAQNFTDDDTFTVTCLAIPKHMEAYPADDNIVFDGGNTSVDDTWTGYISDGDAVLAEPEDYMTLR